MNDFWFKIIIITILRCCCCRCCFCFISSQQPYRSHFYMCTFVCSFGVCNMQCGGSGCCSVTAIHQYTITTDMCMCVCFDLYFEHSTFLSTTKNLKMQQSNEMEIQTFHDYNRINVDWATQQYNTSRPFFLLSSVPWCWCEKCVECMCVCVHMCVCVNQRWREH